MDELLEQLISAQERVSELPEHSSIPLNRPIRKLYEPSTNNGYLGINNRMEAYLEELLQVLATRFRRHFALQRILLSLC